MIATVERPSIPRLSMFIWLLAFVTSVTMAAPSDAQEAPENPLESQARMARRGAGLRAGFWSVRGLREVTDAENSEWPFLEGYFQHGLDRHLALQSSVGLWRRTQELETDGGIGGPTTDRVTTWVVPMFSALRFFPLTGPDQAFEPFVEGGVGFALGIEDRETGDGSLLGAGGSGIGTVVGFGFKGGLGTEWRFSPALGLAVGGRYQWIRFLEELGNDEIFRGFAAEAGLTYRFQFGG